MLKKILEWKLKWLAKSVLRRHKPKIIAITGSVGKTSTKDAIFDVVSRKFTAWKSTGNYNNEIGVPLTIFGATSGKKNIFLWLAVFGRYLRALVGRDYPQCLVIEMGADRIGNIDYLVKIARPDVAVVTRVGEAHMEFLGDLETIQREKSRLVAGLPEGGVAILNCDDSRVLAMKQLHPRHVISYGLGEKADARARNIVIYQNPNPSFSEAANGLGTQFELVYKNRAVPIRVPGLLGNPTVYSLLAAFCVGKAVGVPEKEIIAALESFSAPAGRLRPLPGIKNTILLDDTYNSSTEAAVEALRVLKQIRARRRIAVLGDMLELGPATETSHRKIGKLASDLGIDMLFTVGERAKFMADEARLSGMAKTKILEFDTSDEARVPLQNRMQEADAVLIKGSQGLRLEKIVEEVMAEPQCAAELLVRQTPDWKAKK